MAAVTRAQIRADAALWTEARTLSDLGELTAQWLEGKITHQPGYGDPEIGEEPGPAPETALLVPWLAAACRAGYVTTQSQPGATDWKTGEDYQRAATEGFCDLDAYYRLGLLAHEAGLIVIARDPAKLPRWRMRFRGAMVVTVDDGWPFTRFGVWLPRAHLTDPHVGYGECHPDAVKAILGAFQVTLIDPEWGANLRLWGVLQRFAEAS